MTFLNAILLAGAAAAAIPLVIHLLTRRRLTTVHWGAMHFLEEIVRTNRRRIRLEQLLLLLIRCALPVVLALCMARPVLTGWKSLAGGAVSSLVVLLDNSYSMQAGDAAETSFSRAVGFVDRAVENLPRGSEVAVVGMAGPVPALAEPTSDRALVRRELDALQSGYASAHLPPALETASGYFVSRMRHADRELIMVSDFQRSSWSPEDGAERRRLREVLDAHPIPPRRVLVRSAGRSEENVCVRSLELSRPLLGVGQKVNLRVNLTNTGRRSVPDLRVYFRADGVEESADRLSLGPGETGQLLFTHRFEQPGSHLLEIQTHADRLKTDNVGYAAVQVLDRLPVLLVNGDPRSESLLGETDYLERALQPFGQTTPGLRNLIEARVIEPDQLNAATLGAVRVAVLANVPRLTQEALDAIRAFVRSGGGVLIFPGDRVDCPWYNRELGGDADRLLPLQIGELAGGRDVEPATIAARHYGHPALEIFNDPRRGSLAAVRIQNWYRLVPPAGDDRAAVNVAVGLDSGDPFLAERAYGEGRVILTCIPIDADWSNLPLRPAFLPLIQELVTYLASNVYPPRNLQVGQTLAALFPALDIDAQAVIVDPAGGQHARRIVEREGTGLLEFDETAQPGVYLVRSPSQDTIHYTVGTPFEESRLARLSEDELLALGEELDATVVDSWEAYRDLEQQRRFGREIWKPLLLVVLILLFAEILLARWFRGRVA